MKVSTNAIGQVLALVMQGINQTMSFLPAGGKFWAAIGISAIQLGLGIVAHYSNVPGTEAIPVADVTSQQNAAIQQEKLP